MPSDGLVNEKAQTIAVGCRILQTDFSILQRLAKAQGVRHSRYIRRLLQAHLRRMARKELFDGHKAPTD